MATITLTRGTTLPDSSDKADFHNLIDTATASIASIVNADIDGSAAIAGTKVSPAFGAQNISTTGSVSCGDLTVTGTVTGINYVPSGLISLWSGAISAIPSGWVICDGTNSTPNLTDRFVIHASADSGDTYDVGDTGGVADVTLTAAQSGLPAHTHGIPHGTGGTGYGASSGRDNLGTSLSSAANTAASAAESHTNLPPYYALAYIMKT